MHKIPAEGLTGDVLLREAVTEYRAIIDLIRASLMERLYPIGPHKWVDIEAIDPNAVVVKMDDGKLYKFTYSISDDNIVTLDKPTEVKTDYVDIKEALAETSMTGDQIFIESVGTADKGKWLIRVIKSGLSGNNKFYSDVVLKEAAPLFNNARVFNKSDDDHIKGKGKAVDNLLGRLTEAKFTPGATTDTGEITAVFEFIQPKGPVAIKVREAFSRGMHDLFGFSIDAYGSGKKTIRNGVRMIEATKITKVSSVDLIVEAGAGGQLIRMTESQNPKQEIDPMKTRMLEAIKQHTPDVFAKIDADTITDDELEAAYREAIAVEAKPATPATPAAGTASVEEVNNSIRMVEARFNMRSTIAASQLPEQAKEKLLQNFALRESFEDADVTQAIKAEAEYLGSLSDSGKPVMHFGEAARVEDKAEKVSDMFDAFFDPAHADHGKVPSFREAYVMVTGDRRVTGRLEHCDTALMRESLGIDMREALNSTSFGDALGNSITRRMQAIYVEQKDLQAWRNVATVTSVNDFRTQERTRIGGYGNLPAVSESGNYNPLTSPGDGKATYAVTKRGGTEKVTLEMIANDDVGAIQRIPQELALAAANTLYEFVFDFFANNPVIHDGKALYHADHNNLFTGAFSASEYAAHRLAMIRQTRAGSGKRTGNQPKFLLLPFEQEETAYNAFVRQANIDKTFVQTMTPTIIPVTYWTDANDWVTVADPMRQAVLEIAFLNGQQEPELFVQDTPNAGSMFSNDEVTYKIRHIYGGNVLVDGEKATTKAVVV